MKYLVTPDMAIPLNNIALLERHEGNLRVHLKRPYGRHSQKTRVTLWLSPDLCAQLTALGLDRLIKTNTQPHDL